MSDRRQESYAVRLEAAELARSREHPTHRANGDEERYAGDQYFMSFTKGLPHHPDTGLLQDSQDYLEFRRAIDEGFIDPFSDRVRHGARYKVVGGAVVDVLIASTPADLDDLENFRQWEAPTAGVVHELSGPDAQAVTMPPAPPLLDPQAPAVLTPGGATGPRANPELVLEMAEVYELAVLRDQEFNDFELGSTNSIVLHSVERLNALPYITVQTGRPRKVNPASGALDPQTVFRGSSPGVEAGPYLSQFLLIGNTDRNGAGSVAEGLISYGSLQVSQKVPVATPGVDYMMTMPEYVRMQRGIKPPAETYLPPQPPPPAAPLPAQRRFISTPRDLATYVHHDALYEAYLNACLILLEMKTPFDPGFDHLSGVGAASEDPKTRRNAGGFALYGGPHILTLVTEVATRALKAVRFQKFNNHIRLRPEALAARIELARLAGLGGGPSVPSTLLSHIGALRAALSSNLDTAATPASTLSSIVNLPGNTANTELLPMAFPEGSPMHPSYGAGHATVAGACVTILKAFFDTSAVLAQYDDGGTTKVAFRRQKPGDASIEFRAPAVGITTDLVASSPTKAGTFLTLEGELNKLAANISIGRDMAGVHYFSDYYDSLQMGEQIAIGILREQALTYPTDPFVISLPRFDGTIERIGRR